MAYIYAIKNLENGKMYIGQTVQRIEARLSRHRNGPFAIGNAIRKYGEEKFVYGIIEECICPVVLNHLEKKYIKEFNSMAPNGYNLMEGGQIRMTKKSIEKMRQSKIGVKQTKGHVENRMNRIRKKIYCYETNKIYASIKEAAEELGIGSASNLASYCRKGKPMKGYNFKFITGGGLLLT